MPSDDVLLNDRVELYSSELKTRYHRYLTLFFPEMKGRRQPLFTEQISEREQFLKLREVARRSALVREGQLPPDLETVRFDRNEDGAQQRLFELARQFDEELES